MNPEANPQRESLPRFASSHLGAFRALALAASVLFPSLAFASTTATTSLPWESPLQTIATSLSGPVAMSISVIGIVVCGGMLIFGGELNDVAKKLIIAVLVIAILTGGTGLVTALFGSSAAVV